MPLNVMVLHFGTSLQARVEIVTLCTIDIVNGPLRCTSNSVVEEIIPVSVVALSTPSTVHQNEVCIGFES